MTYHLGVDLGTTFTAAAIARNGEARIVELGARAAAVPSVVFLKEDESLLLGEIAERRATTDSSRVAREFKRRFGDTTPIILGSSPYSAEALMARLLRWVVDAVAEREGSPPATVTVSHPANWGPYKIELLGQAVRLADLDDARIISEPEAAALHYASLERVEPGRVVAVYDLGGGTFDAAILRKTADGFEYLGEPEGIERLGGIDFDEAIFHHVRESLGDRLAHLDPTDPSTVVALGRLRQDCVAVKEALSVDTDASIPVMLPGLQTEVRLTRHELEAMIRPRLADSVDALGRAIRRAGLQPEQVDAVLLVGGSSRIPLVGETITASLGRPVVVDTHPKHAVALGAALHGARQAGGAAGGDRPVEPPAEPIAAGPAPGAPPPPADVPAPPPAPPPAGPPPGPTTPGVPPPAGRRRTAGLALGALALVAAVVIIVVLVSRGGDGESVVAGEPTAGPTTGGTPEPTPPTDPTTAPTPTTEPTPSPTTAPTPTPEPTPAFPPDTRRVELDSIALDGDRYVVEYGTVNFEPLISPTAGTFHIHFFWDVFDPSTVGTQEPAATRGDWQIWDVASDGSLVFDAFGPSLVPPGATAICGVVADHLHAVDQPELADDTVSCVDLPA